MFLLFVFAALATTAERLPTIAGQATATIRIVRPTIADRTAWEHSEKAFRRETINRDEHGQPILLRVIDNQ